MKDSNKRFVFKIFWATGLFIVIGTGCKREKAILPEVSTIEVTVVTPVSASCSGEVISAGSTKLVEKGLCWSDSPSPTIEDSTVTTYSVSVRLSLPPALKLLTRPKKSLQINN